MEKGQIDLGVVTFVCIVIVTILIIFAAASDTFNL